MKRSIVYILTALMIAVVIMLTGCKSDTKPTEAAKTETTAQTETAAQQSSGAVSAADVVFNYNGKSVELNCDEAAMTAALGEANSVSSQLSCHGEGEDKTYTYNGFIVNTYPSNGVNRVMEIVVSSADHPTSKGIKVGDTASAVTTAYGDNYKKVGAYYSYSAGGDMALQFFIENGTVTEIDYYYNVTTVS